MQEQIIDALRRNAADEAVTLAQQWTQAEPQQARAHRWLGLALQQQGNLVAAAASVDQALTLAPDDADLHLQRAGLLLAARDIGAANTALSRSTELDPNQLSAYVMQAHLAIGRGDLDEAERLSKVASRVDPDHPQLLVIDGLLSLRRGDADRALALLSRAAEVLPDDPRALYALGFAYLEKQHLAFAETAFRRVISISPSLPLQAMVAQLAQRQGNMTEAADAMAQVLAHADGDTPAMRRVAGEFELQAGRPAEAVAHLKQALLAAPADRRTLQGLLMAWNRLGTLDDARSTLETALASVGDAHDLWLARLAVEPVAGDEARAVIERWQQAMPEHLPALEAQMRLHDMTGESDAAETVARRIVALQPGRTSGEERIVGALLEREPAAAVAHVRQLIAEAPEEARAPLRNWLAVVQDRAGQPGDALATWLEQHAIDAPNRLPLPPQAKAPPSWPELAPVDPALVARPLFVWGPPGSGVERVVAVLNAASPVLRGDRFGPNPPKDPLQRFDTLQELATGALTPQQLVQQWRDALPARGIADGNVIDWLLWWDNALLWALRQQLPEGRLLVVLRDPRDMLLDWLAFGELVPMAITSVNEAAEWLARALAQVANLHEQTLYPYQLVRIDGLENNPEAMAQVLEHAFGSRFPVLPNLGPVRLPSGHWRTYAQPLSAAFALLTPVAVRLGYTET